MQRVGVSVLSQCARARWGENESEQRFHRELRHLRQKKMGDRWLSSL